MVLWVQKKMIGLLDEDIDDLVLKKMNSKSKPALNIGELMKEEAPERLRNKKRKYNLI